MSTATDTFFDKALRYLSYQTPQILKGAGPEWMPAPATHMSPSRDGELRQELSDLWESLSPEDQAAQNAWLQGIFNEDPNQRVLIEALPHWGGPPRVYIGPWAKGTPLDFPYLWNQKGVWEKYNKAAELRREEGLLWDAVMDTLRRLIYAGAPGYSIERRDSEGGALVLKCVRDVISTEGEVAHSRILVLALPTLGGDGGKRWWVWEETRSLWSGEDHAEKVAEGHQEILKELHSAGVELPADLEVTYCEGANTDRYSEFRWFK